MSELKTTWEDSEGIEWEVKIDYDFQPFKPMTKDYPGCYADVTVNSVRKDLPDHFFSVDCTEETAKEHTDWEVEILEAINQQGQDDEDAHGDMLHDQAKDDALTGDV